MLNRSTSRNKTENLGNVKYYFFLLHLVNINKRIQDVSNFYDHSSLGYSLNLNKKKMLRKYIRRLELYSKVMIKV